MSAATRRSEPPTVFLDSNVIFSALHSPDGPPGSVLRAMFEGRMIAVVSRQVLDELIRTFQRKLPSATGALREFLLNSPLSVVADPTPAETRRWLDILDSGDASILAAALEVEPDFFVTGDSHFLDNPALARRTSVAICSPAELLSFLHDQQSGP